MDFIDKVNELSIRAKKIINLENSLQTEEATKNALVMPFIQTLGFDIFDPSEVIPEYTADHGLKKGEKVDYAIKKDNELIIIIECKKLGANLIENNTGQLFRYFSVSNSRVGILTDGIYYLFFSDLDNPNKMDEKPFFKFNITEFTEEDILTLKRFSKNKFDTNKIISSANNLKYHNELLFLIQSEFLNPSEDFLKYFIRKVYERKITSSVHEKLSSITKQAMNDFINKKVEERFKNALEVSPVSLPTTDSDSFVSEIITTEEEVEGFRIIQAICSEFAEPSDIIMRDAKSYCAVLYKDNNRKPIVRMHFNGKVNKITLFSSTEEKLELTKLSDIFLYRSKILHTLNQYIELENK